MRTERLLALAAIAAAVLAGCNTARRVSNESDGNCVACHGGSANETGAPPTDLAGNETGNAVGFHTEHVNAGVTCDSCHVVPTSTNSPGHIDDDRRAEVVFGAAATLNGATPTYAPLASPGRGGTCNGTYCHAPRDANTHELLSIGGLNRPNPVWTAVSPGGGCLQCHGFPPPPNHPQNADCSSCHPTSVNDDETFKAGGTHLNGVIDVGSIHPANWVTPGALVQPHGFAADYHDPSYPNGIADCRGCHGTDLAGGTTGFSCTQCHTWPPVVTGTAQVDCTFCHGDPARVTATPLDKVAPPIDTQGHSAPTERGVGAHQTHLAGELVSSGVACGSCHAGQPYVDLAHVNGQVALALLQPNTATAAGTFDPAAGTCASTYCHGALTRNPKPGNTPAWTQTSGQSACDSCHQPQSSAAASTDDHWNHVNPADRAIGCSVCHGTGYAGTGVTGAARGTHVSGSVNVGRGYDPTTHTCAAAGCHGSDKAWY